MAMTFEILEPSGTVEASASTEPDDISRATIRIKASWKTPVPTAETKIVFAVPISGTGRLTGNPKSITPVVKEHGAWTFREESEANGKFVASLKPGAVLPADSFVTFLLHDIEIVMEEGDSFITVTENGADVLPALKVKKIPAALRIDYFRTLASPSVLSNTPVTLDWQTTGATKVSLRGPDGSFVKRPGVTVTPPAPDGTTVIPGKLIDGEEPRDKDGSVVVSPITTSTYTLIAQKGNDEKVRAVQQVTVTVTDHTQINGVLDVVGTGSVTGGLNVIGGITGPGSIPESKVVGGEIQGAILMWSGVTAPEGWELCDGRELTVGIVRCKTPDLKDRFVLGKGRRALRDIEGGAETVTLLDGEIPAHTHTTSTDEAGSHSHSLPRVNISRLAGGTIVFGVVTSTTPPSSHSIGASGVHTHTVTVNANTSAGEAHNNMPPFYVLAFIIRLPAGAVPVP